MCVCPLARGPADIAVVRAQRAGAPGGDVGVVPAGRAAGDAEAPAGPLHEVRRPEGPRRWAFRGDGRGLSALAGCKMISSMHGMLTQFCTVQTAKS